LWKIEPVTTTAIYSTLCYFIGYYVGADLHNYYKQTVRHNETINKLDSIESRLSSIESRIK
jgi:hypothetical protein